MERIALVGVGQTGFERRKTDTYEELDRKSTRLNSSHRL